VLKSLQGKSGAAGPAGVAGAAGVVGAQGPQGPAGPAGAAGAKGETGPAGKDGAAGKTGATGPQGEESEVGNPWTVGGALPKDATETGLWSFGELAANVNAIHIPISFLIPLTTELDAGHVHFINLNNKEVLANATEVESSVCTGTASAPKAVAGNLCIYTRTITGFAPNEITNADIGKGLGVDGGGALTDGAFLLLAFPEKGAIGFGS
jgi:hypothetical protein